MLLKKERSERSELSVTIERSERSERSRCCVALQTVARGLGLNVLHPPLFSWFYCRLSKLRQERDPFSMGADVGVKG
jgi:hypothetical protein